MSRTTTRGRRLETAPSPKKPRISRAPEADLDFATTWNALEKDDRRQIRRLVRIGRPQEDASDAELAAGFAAFQRSRLWYRYFWLWIVPLSVAGVIAGLALHPIVVGMVFGAVVSAIFVRRNFKRADKVNHVLLGAPVVPVAA